MQHGGHHKASDSNHDKLDIKEIMLKIKCQNIVKHYDYTKLYLSKLIPCLEALDNNAASATFWRIYA